ncbi:snRNA-activating protein complex subunit 2 [Narcine bancroftii]|uniref:snRNA-activating protein complex subunit 2 n=1 Tax=Narcine bancroftii TaxID=1343680 RepID=UPI003831C05C
MKPPVRARAAPRRYGAETVPRGADGEGEEWSHKERRALLRALSRQSGARDIDLFPIEAAVSTRSTHEVATFIEDLKLRSARSALQREVNQRVRGRQRLRAPLQIWTELAESATGSVDLGICTAVCQTLMIAATEPVCRQHSVPPVTARGQGTAAVGAESVGETADESLPTEGPCEQGSDSPSLDHLDPDRQDQQLDFARIYRFLVAAVRGAPLPQLAPMESAVMLDLLLSLPAEVEGLRIRELTAHMEQSHDRLERTIRCSWTPVAGTSTPHPAPASDDEPGSQQAMAWPLNPFGVPLGLLATAVSSDLNPLHYSVPTPPSPLPSSSPPPSAPPPSLS